MLPIVCNINEWTNTHSYPHQYCHSVPFLSLLENHHCLQIEHVSIHCLQWLTKQRHTSNDNQDLQFCSKTLGLAPRLHWLPVCTAMQALWLLVLSLPLLPQNSDLNVLPRFFLRHHDPFHPFLLLRLFRSLHLHH